MGRGCPSKYYDIEGIALDRDSFTSQEDVIAEATPNHKNSDYIGGGMPPPPQTQMFSYSPCYMDS